jgi:hypothetical protein
MATTKSEAASSKPVVEPVTKRRLKLADLATDQDFLLGGTDLLLNDLPVRKPHRNWFFRVHPDTKLTAIVFVLEDDRDSAEYVVGGEALSMLREYVKRKQLFVCQNDAGNLFVWLIGQPIDMKNDWNSSALSIAEVARGKWIQCKSNRQLGRYQAHEPMSTTIPDPDWPEKIGDIDEVVDLTFGDRVIADLEHPVAKRVLGLGDGEV